MRRFLRSGQASASPAKFLTLLLILALFYTQGLGLVHDIFHAGFAQTAQRQAFSAALFNHVEQHGDALVVATGPHGKTTSATSATPAGSSATHSAWGDHDDDCDAFDAAAIAAGVHVTIPALPVVPSAYVLALWVAFASRDIPFLRRFASRAPPAHAAA